MRGSSASRAGPRSPMRDHIVLRSYIRRLSRTRFWFSKWIVAAAVAVLFLLASLFLLSTSTLDFDTFLNYFALGLLIFVFITLFYGIIAIHDVPYEIARHRNHPHQDAIHAAGWVSLFTLHALWPFLWIWAMLYRPDRGWGLDDAQAKNAPSLSAPHSIPHSIEALQQRVTDLERRSTGIH
jgi:hypothetical protein